MEEANRVGVHALTLEPDSRASYHHVWLALDDALAGRTEAAQQRLADLPRGHLDAWHQYFAALTDALLLVQAAPAAERGRAFREARQRLAEAEARSEPLPHDRCLKRTYRECVRQIGRACGLTGRAWAWWRCVVPLLPKEKKD
jgi:hypothetical protein